MVAKEFPCEGRISVNYSTITEENLDLLGRIWTNGQNVEGFLFSPPPKLMPKSQSGHLVWKHGLFQNRKYVWKNGEEVLCGCPTFWPKPSPHFLTKGIVKELKQYVLEKRDVVGGESSLPDMSTVLLFCRLKSYPLHVPSSSGFSASNSAPGDSFWFPCSCAYPFQTGLSTWNLNTSWQKSTTNKLSYLNRVDA